MSNGLLAAIFCAQLSAKILKNGKMPLMKVSWGCATHSHTHSHTLLHTGTHRERKKSPKICGSAALQWLARLQKSKQGQAKGSYPRARGRERGRGVEGGRRKVAGTGRACRLTISQSEKSCMWFFSSPFSLISAAAAFFPAFPTLVCRAILFALINWAMCLRWARGQGGRGGANTNRQRAEGS